MTKKQIMIQLHTEAEIIISNVKTFRNKLSKDIIDLTSINKASNSLHILCECLELESEKTDEKQD